MDNQNKADSAHFQAIDSNTTERLAGLPTEELVAESLAAGPTGAVLAEFDGARGQWKYVASDRAESLRKRGVEVLTVYVEES